MRETRPSGSVEGVMSNRDPYSDKRLHGWRMANTVFTSTRSVHLPVSLPPRESDAPSALGCPGKRRPPFCTCGHEWNRFELAVSAPPICTDGLKLSASPKPRNGSLASHGASKSSLGFAHSSPMVTRHSRVLGVAAQNSCIPSYRSPNPEQPWR
jgi:hypothetical protein